MTIPEKETKYEVLEWKENKLRQLFYSGKVNFAVQNEIPRPCMVDIAANTGYDFIFLDQEHSVYDLQMVEHMVRAAETRIWASRHGQDAQSRPICGCQGIRHGG